MVAAEQYAAFESRLLECCKSNQNLDICLVARCALVIWGDCPSLKEADRWLEIYAKTPLIHGAPFQLLNVGPEGQSRTVAGWAHLACLAWMQRGHPPRVAPLKSIFGQGISESDFNSTVRYSRTIRLPSVFADILSEQLPHIELPRERLLDFLYDRTADPAAPRFNAGLRIKAPIPIAITTYKRSLKEEFDELRSLIPTVKAKNETVLASHKTMQKNVHNWRLTSSIRPLTKLLAHWGELLLGEYANLKTAETLKRKTVSSYLYDVWSTITTVYPDGDFFDLDAVEITEQLDAALFAASNIARERTGSINRFFYQMAQYYDMPNVSLKTDPGDVRASIEACVITPKEQKLARAQLLNWSKDSDIKPAVTQGLKQLNILAGIFGDEGARSNEALKLRNQDILTTEQGQILHIRPHPDRSIKTRSGTRSFPLTGQVSTSDRDKRTKHLLDILNKPEIESLIMPTYSAILKIVTNDNRSHPYHIRHTVVSQKALLAMQMVDPIARTRALTQMSADIGHAGVSISLQYYSHASHHAIALLMATQKGELDNAVLIKWFNENPGTLRKMKHRARNEGFPLEAQFANRRSATKIRQVTPNLLLHPIPPDWVLASAPPLSLKSTMLWTLCVARGLDPTEAASNVPISVSQLKRLANAILITQTQLKWEVISESRLRHICDNHFSERPIYIEVSPSHKYFPTGWIDKQIQVMDPAIMTVPSIILQSMLGVRLARKASVDVHSTDIDALILAIKGCGLSMRYQALGSNQYRILPDTGEAEVKLDRNLSRLVVLVLVAHQCSATIRMTAGQDS